MDRGMVEDVNAAVCTPRYLPKEKLAEAIAIAERIEPSNHGSGVTSDVRDGDGDRLALDIRRRWNRNTGVRLTVAFLDGPPVDLQKLILSHMNAWSLSANVRFVPSSIDPQVRIARFDEASAPGMAGYWSYLGTDILLIPKDRPTMNLQNFTMKTPDPEFHRVVRHETGHTMGFPHEHMRKELVERLDRRKVIEYFMRTQGWPEQMVIDQVLTPLEESSIFGTTDADARSIMCYQIPGFLTKDGQPILGGTDIDPTDRAFARACYPKHVH